jgi:predicted XRE-type DNA-binding protein
MLGTLYFMRERPDGPVKIGWTSKPVTRRLYTLQIGNPRALVLIGVIEGVERAVEAEWHEEFRYCRCRGEWFHPLPDLLMKIRKLVPGAEALKPSRAVSHRVADGCMRSLSIWLRDKNIRQREFAEHLEITDSTMSQIMTGRRKIGRGMATRIELATGGAVKAADLLGLSQLTSREAGATA